MLEEEHRHEDRQQRRKERQVEREKRQEDRRRKQWEEYEKCMQRETEIGTDQHCVAPSFHTPVTGRRRRDRRYSLEPVKSQDSREGQEEAWSGDEDDDSDANYFSAPFFGKNRAKEPVTENDLAAQRDTKKPAPKAPTQETTKKPNSPWQQLNTLPVEGDNDINFDVDQHFKFRMPTDANFRGHDVKFNVKLPPDLLGGVAGTPASQPAGPTAPTRPARPTGPGGAGA